MSMPGLVGGIPDLWNMAPDPLGVGGLPREFLCQTRSLGSGWGGSGDTWLVWECPTLQEGSGASVSVAEEPQEGSRLASYSSLLYSDSRG